MNGRPLGVFVGIACLGLGVAAAAGGEPSVPVGSSSAGEGAPVLERVDKIEKRVVDLESRMGRTLQPSTSVNTVEKRLQRVEQTLVQMETRLDQMEQRLRRLETKR